MLRCFDASMLQSSVFSLQSSVFSLQSSVFGLRSQMRIDVVSTLSRKDPVLAY